MEQATREAGTAPATQAQWLRQFRQLTHPELADKKNQIENQQICLIDGSGYIFRAYYALPAMNRTDGTPVNAVYGFCSMISQWIDNPENQYIGVIFDHSRKSFRNQIFPDYKANRIEVPEDLAPQFSIIREAVEAFGLFAIHQEGFEADDLIATYARLACEKNIKTKIISSDKDLMQLVDDNTIMFDPMKKKMIKTREVIEKFGVAPDRVCDVQALAGDSSDNVPGVPGIGLKTASLLINEFNDLENLLNNADKIPQTKRRQTIQDHSELARLSYKLVCLERHVDVLAGIESFKAKSPDLERIIDFLERQNFYSLVKRFAQRYSYQIDVRKPGLEQFITGPKKYQLITTLAQLQNWVERAFNQGYVSIETKMTGLVDGLKDGWVGISMALNRGEACYIPLQNDDHNAQDDLMKQADALSADQKPHEQNITGILQINDVVKILKPLFESKKIIKIGHNIKHDINLLNHYDIALDSIEDTMAMSFVLHAGQHQHKLDDLSSIYLKHKMTAIEDVIGSGRHKKMFKEVPLAQACDCASEMSDITLQLYFLFRKELVTQKLNHIYMRIDRPLIQILSQMERHGVCLDPMKLKALSDDFQIRAHQLEQQIHDLAGQVFNLASPKQLGQILFDKLSIPGAKRSKTGAFVTASEILEPLSGEHLIIAKLLEWRSLTKLKSTYCDALLREIKGVEKRIHTHYSITGAQTGRLSSTDPNLQNIPVRTLEGRMIRKAFIAPAEKFLVSLDYSQIELRLLAEIGEIKELQQAFYDDLDIHAMTASQVFNVALDQVSKDLRRQAKAVNFGIIYGISAFGLARQLNCTQSEARQFIEAYLKHFNGVKKFMDNTIEQARADGFVETVFGRRIHLTGINDKNAKKRHYSERQAINAPIQGSSADIIKRAMIKMPAALKKGGLSGHEMRLQVH
ncbi:MAG: DNA polymerase I, partial [Pseudomonadota bacterium]